MPSSEKGEHEAFIELKQLTSLDAQKIKHEKILVKLCSVEKSIITDPLIQLTKSPLKHRFSLHSLLCYQRSSRYQNQKQFLTHH